MPDKRSHRGMHPEDARLFAPDQWPALRLAVAELSWLITRGYAEPSAVKLVGDRHRLDARQRMAVLRSMCTDAALAGRTARRVAAADVAGRALHIDGYNVLTTIEAALSGGVILAARDGCYRDVASMHGSYRKVEETVPAMRLAGQALAGLRAGACIWYLDAPVSNSGRLKALLQEEAAAQGWPWTVEIVQNPDAVLLRTTEIVCTADSVILDGDVRWLNLAREIVAAGVPEAYVVDLARG
ncbi:MAG: DUF434 domain-containing protein [Tepidisphaerales bacterium]